MIKLNEDFDNFSIPTQDLRSWYREMKGLSTDDIQTQQNEVKVAKPSQSISDLMIYAIQLRCYANFLVAVANSIEGDIKLDIEKDNTIIPASVVDSVEISGQPITEMPKPLDFAIKNRDAINTAASNVSELSKAIDSILSRVKR